MSEQGCGDAVLSAFMNVFLSPWFWVVMVLFACVVVVPLYIDIGNVNAPEDLGGYDLTDTGLNRDSACCAAIVAPLLLALAAALEWQEATDVPSAEGASIPIARSLGVSSQSGPVLVLRESGRPCGPALCADGFVWG